VKSIFKLSALSAAVLLSACSVLQSDKVDYRSTVKATSLDIPPDLTQLSKDTRYTMVDGAVSASSGNKTAANPGTKPAIAAPVVGDIRIERSGNQRWLVVKRPADKLWGQLKDFWQDNGFILIVNQSDTGIMETDWAENRANIPQDFIRSTIGKLLDSVYSTGERDKYRTRVETNTAGETEIYISHRGMQEVNVKDGTGTVWQPRAADPELEAEFLRKLMVRLGASPTQADAIVATTPPAKQVATVSIVNGQPKVTISEEIDRAWRRVGLALDRTGFTVEDRDRKQGLYFVRYVAPNPEMKDQGFFGRMFSSTPKPNEAAKFQISVKSQGDSTVVSVLDAKGAPDSSASAQKIVKVIADDIK
jgi:outer membrane protein assembly factor BamC